MSYRVERNNNRHDVIESETEVVVNSYSNNREARRVCRGLNLGAGFDGHTPKFFSEKFKPIKKATTQSE